MSKLSDNQLLYNQLHDITEKLKKELNLTPCVGVEIEFYLKNISDISLLEKNIQRKIKSERGQNQYEVDFEPSLDIAEYAKYITNFKQNAKKCVNDIGGEITFAAKPYENDYGSSMHIHLNFLEDENIQRFAKILCYYLKDDLSIFLPQKNSYKRLDERFMAPTHICYGGNNRSVAIRVPDSLPVRIEHRLAGADCNAFKVMYTILLSIYKGMKNEVWRNSKYQKIHGNAFDPQYSLESIKLD